MRVFFELFDRFASPHREDPIRGPDASGVRRLKASWVRACGSDGGIECYR